MFVICLTYISHRMPKTCMDNDFHWIILTTMSVLSLFFYLFINSSLCIFVLSNLICPRFITTKSIWIKTSKLMPIPTTEAETHLQRNKKRINSRTLVYSLFKFGLVHFSCLSVFFYKYTYIFRVCILSIQSSMFFCSIIWFDFETRIN